MGDKKYNITVKDEEGNVLYFSKYDGKISIPMGHILKLKKLHEQFKSRKRD